MKCKIGGQTVELEIEGRVQDNARKLSGGTSQQIHRRKPIDSTPDAPLAARPNAAPPFSFTLSGQIRGGKNNMKVGRNGRHYPDKTFAKWRDNAVRHVYHQRCTIMKLVSQLRVPMYSKPVELCIEVHYAAGDLRRRDIPGMLDALYHVLEKAQVVEDDAQIQEAHWYQEPLNREHPSVRVTVKERMG